ncbi:MAG: nitrilase-related carbon-nitrogen hydrolase [Paludibacteraceae bacterium]|nr:nitrilase family protein [Bacteroidales bacterium]MDD5990838.1 nitrilase family protein [Paludibacteraceae bacterium]MDD6748111.1 nitrilase family protein [Paludibacteraceae bacterium]MDY5651374.1 nitrilase-related carbon-nitrogen hydrolase [Paludibacteraceae bacterium]
MRIALLQYPIEWANPQANVGLLNERLQAIAGQADIAVIPEMFSTGFCTDRPGLAEEWITGPTSQALQHMANTYDLAIIGSMIVSEQGRLYNRGFMFRPNDTPLYYNKHHLYRSGGEAEFFTPGNKRPIWDFRGIKIRLAVCYDLRFPVWLRQDKHNLYDILICVACWPTVRIQYWDVLLPTRAAENHCYAVGVNMVGTDGIQMDYNGHSVAYDTWLKDIAGFEDYEAGTRIVDFSIEKLRHFREVLPQWQEADEYTIKNGD